MELTLLDYHMVHYRPSEIAAASLYLSQLLLEGLPWVSLLKPLCLLNLSMLLQLGSVSSVSDAAALLELRRGPPEAHRAAYRQKRGDGDRGEKQVHGEFGPRVEWLSGRMKLKCLFSEGCEEQILEQQAAEDQPPPSAEERRRQRHGSSSAQLITLLIFFNLYIFFVIYAYGPFCLFSFFFLIKCFIF